MKETRFQKGDRILVDWYKLILALHSRGTEEVFQALEDNQVALSAMKASRFVKAFEKEVDHWERCLSLILEVIEMVLTVQRQWMYLEVRISCLGSFYILFLLPYCLNSR